MCAKVVRKRGWKYKGIKNKKLNHRNVLRAEKESLGVCI